MTVKHLYDCKKSWMTAEVWKYGEHVIRISYTHPEERYVGKPFDADLEVCEADGTKWNSFLSLKDSLATLEKHGPGRATCEKVSYVDRKIRVRDRLFDAFRKTQNALRGD